MATEKNIDVRDQVALSFEKSFRFCLKGISYRLFRSSLTLAVVVVAVAFFTFLLSESLMLRSTAAGVHAEMADARVADRLLVHLFHRYSSRDLSAKLADIRESPEALAEIARITNMTESDVHTLAQQCYVEQLFLHFFRTLSPGKRVVLVKKNAGRDVFTYLSGDQEWNEFLEALAKMRSVRLPLSRLTLRSFLDERDAFMAALQALRVAREKTVESLEQALVVLTGGQDHGRWLGAASDEAVERWRTTVVNHGFTLPVDDMQHVREILRLTLLENRIATVLQSPEMRDAWKVKFQSTPGLETKISMLSEASVAELLGDAFTDQERISVANRFARLKHLRDLLGKLPPVSNSLIEGPRFLDGRQWFLIGISFLVCMVGIANAMLMSITERFREIATMKCLGATDGFILKQFLIEAAIQGVVGGSIGMVIGMVISILKSALMYGGMVFVHFPVMHIVYCGLGTILTGIVLAMLASVYPSHAAARMAPMDAMRVE